MIDPRADIGACGGTRAGVMGDTRQKAEGRKQKWLRQAGRSCVSAEHFCLLPSAFCLASYDSYDAHGTIRTMKSTPLLSDLELALIGLIREQPRSGYALRKAIVDFPQFSDSPGAIYPALRRLRAGGLIEVSGDATPRKTEVFRITAAGR